MIYKRILIILFLSAIIISCNSKRDNSSIHENHAAQSSDSSTITNIEVKTFAMDGGWGYDIYVNNERYIHQTNIPAVNGLYIFKTEDDARKVADLMVQKIRSNIVPPSISQEELEMLGVRVE